MLNQFSFPCVDYDGMATFEAASYEKIFECFQDEEYHKVVVPDEEKFIDKGRSKAFPVDIVDVIDDPT